MDDKGCCLNGGKERTEWNCQDDAASGLWSKSVEESSIGTCGGITPIAGEGCSGGGVGDWHCEEMTFETDIASSNGDAGSGNSMTLGAGEHA